MPNESKCSLSRDAAGGHRRSACDCCNAHGPCVTQCIDVLLQSIFDRARPGLHGPSMHGPQQLGEGSAPPAGPGSTEAAAPLPGGRDARNAAAQLTLPTGAYVQPPQQLASAAPAPPVWPGMQPQWPQQQWQQPAVNAAPHLVRWPCSSCFPVVLLLHTLLCKCWMCFKLW